MYSVAVISIFGKFKYGIFLINYERPSSYKHPLTLGILSWTLKTHPSP